MGRTSLGIKHMQSALENATNETNFYKNFNDNFPKTTSELSDIIVETISSIESFIDSGELGTSKPNLDETLPYEKLSRQAQILYKIKLLNALHFKRREWRDITTSDLITNGYAKVALKLLKTTNEVGVFKNDEVWHYSWYTLSTVWNSSDVNSSLATEYAKAGFIQYCLSNISHQPYINNLQTKNVEYVIRSSLSILHNMSKLRDITHVYRNNNAISCVKYMANNGTDIIKTVAIMTLYNIMDEKEANELTDIRETVTYIVNSLGAAIEADNKRSHGFTVLELCEVLQRIAGNDVFKLALIDDGVLEHYIEVLQPRELVQLEQRICVKTIWNIAFNDAACRIIKHSEKCMQLLRDYQSSSDIKMAKLAQGALWKIEDKDDKHVAIASLDRVKQHRQATSSTIFISYSWKQQETILKINQHLKQAKFKTWIDKEQMKGSLLEAMAKGIEEAAVVLICVSDTYKLSPNCRQEAEYAYSLHKPLIPLMMTQNYRPDGWLGMLVGAKLFFNFQGREKYPFDGEMYKLITAINERIDEDKISNSEATIVEDSLLGTERMHTDIFAQTKAPAETQQAQIVSFKEERESAGSRKELACGKWSVSETAAWLAGLQLSREYEDFTEMDGEMLQGTIIMRNQAPDSYYNILSTNVKMPFSDIIKFTNAADKLI